MFKIKRNDEVIVITGKDKGKRGTVLSVIKNCYIIVSGINVVKKHQKSNSNLDKVGGIIEQEASIHISNVAIYNSKTQRADRVGFRFYNGKKVRFFKLNDALIDAS